MQDSTPPPSDALVIFGITGDLAFKKIFPALENLERRGRLPGIVVGVARGGTTREALLERMRQSLAKHGDEVCESAAARLAGKLRMVDGDYRDDATFAALRSELAGGRRPFGCRTAAFSGSVRRPRVPWPPGWNRDQTGLC